MPDTTVSETEQVMSEMKTKKAPRYDEIVNLFKVDILALIFTHWWNLKIILCSREKSIPSIWNKVSTLLVYFKENKTDVENYKPISSTSDLYKLFTTILTMRLESEKLIN